MFVQLLLIAAVFDALTYEIPDWIHVLILLGGFVRMNPMDSLVGFFLISTLFLLLAMVTGGGIGGGDIKLMAACGFVLGSVGVVLATFFSIMLMLPVNFKWIFRREDRRREYAMAPYLAVGCFFAYLFL
jgi:leader peptidase (prepilin peptidase)/N-methyltransferase